MKSRRNINANYVARKGLSLIEPLLLSEEDLSDIFLLSFVLTAAMIGTYLNCILEIKIVRVGW